MEEEDEDEPQGTNGNLPGHDVPDATLWDSLPVYMEYEAGDGPEPTDFIFPCIRRGKDDPPFLTPIEEKRLITRQVEESKGFDIEFDKFRCVFNYRPVDFDLDDPYLLMKSDTTTKGLMDRLSRESLTLYNKREETHYEFEEVVKANFHLEITTGNLYYITFKAKEPLDAASTTFQARVCNYCFKPDTYPYCEIKPEKKRGHFNETLKEEDEDAKEEDEDAKRQKIDGGEPAHP